MTSARDVIEEVLDIRCEGCDRNTADAIIAALDAAGYAVVPKEPTEAMLTAKIHNVYAKQWVMESRADLRPTIWKVMLTAAKETTSQAAGGEG